MARKIKTFDYNDTFPRRFRELLESREDITQEAIAELVGVTRQTVGNWYSGKSAPDAVSLAKIADEFHVSIDWLLRENAPKQIDAELSAVCEYTGLSEKAVQLLSHWNRFSMKESSLDSFYTILDMIICGDEDEDLLFWLSGYRDALRVYKMFQEESYDSEKLAGMVNNNSLPYGVRVQARYLLALEDAHSNGLASMQEDSGKYSDLSITTDELRFSLSDVYMAKAQSKFNTLLEKIYDSIFGDPITRAVRQISEEIQKRAKKSGETNGEHPEADN